jgi:hypothetical protein
VDDPTVKPERLRAMSEQPRVLAEAIRGDEDLGRLSLLPGTWKSAGGGWNMIALPYVPSGDLNYRLLLNQYDEQLNFALVDKAAANRGIDDGVTRQTDQFVVTLGYEQVIQQVAVIDRPASAAQGAINATIHHEPGLFLQLLNQTSDGLEVARLASVPHGVSALALGSSSVVEGIAPIPHTTGFPEGAGTDIGNSYLEPYRFFRDHPFMGKVATPGFPGFNPLEPCRLLAHANEGLTVTRTTVLDFDTRHSTGGIHNIPFVVEQANAVSMTSTFWIHELADPENHGNHRLRMQYLQVVDLEFGARLDGAPGLIGWPHISINTLDKVSDTLLPFGDSGSLG